MENYLLDGRCSLSNNAAENAIRPFTVGRKNWLFADTPKGADASAAIYSLVETAKANGLNIYALKADIELYLGDRNVTQIELMKKHDISRNTLKKYIKLMQQPKGE